VLTAWVDDQLTRAGIERTGELEQAQLRPWATVLKAETTGGTVWFKSLGAATAFEAGLYELLARTVPEHVLRPIATDRTRAWILLPDGGSSLGQDLTEGKLTDNELTNAMASALAAYGQLQRRLAPHTAELLVLGIADMRAPIMATRFDEALEAVGEQLDTLDDSAGKASLPRVVALRGTVASWCEQLAAVGPLASLDHNDLHPWNILAGGRGTRFYDWGDSVVAHPFASLLVPLNSLQHHLRATPTDPRLLRVRDAYLDVFSDLAARKQLVETLELACRVGKIARALAWHRSLSAQGYDQSGKFAAAPLRCLTSLLDASYLGGA